LKNSLLILFFAVVYLSAAYAQTDSVQWALNVDSNAVAIGNIVGRSETFSNMVVRSYNGGVCQKSAPTTAGDWVTEATQNNTRFIQFAASPAPGCNFNVTTISFNIGWAGTGNMRANVYYSTDSTFTTKTQLGTTITIPNPGPTLNGSTSLNIPVIDGKAVFVRFYPWNTATASAKSLGIAGLLIAGTATAAGSPVLTIIPSTISFGTIKTNMTRDFSFTLSGTLLNPTSDSIRITPPNGFDVSTTQGSGYSSYLALPYSGATLNQDTVFVRFMPSLIHAYSGNISVSGGGITPQTIAVSGTAVDPSTILGIFVSTSGNDTNTGTYAQSYLTLQKAISVAQPGDTIFVRAGTYANNTTIGISQSGTSGNLICLYEYPPDNSRPVLDFSSMSFSGSNRGVNLAGSYWHIKGLDIYKAGDNGMYTSGSHNIVEDCVFRENRDGGCQVGGGASSNQYINCDSYFNFDDTGDTTTAGGNADGFSPKLDVGTGNYFYGCRSWQNSDDGWDGYLRPSDDVSTTIENCWSFMNGYLKDGVTSYSTMNGNGIKMGGSDAKNLRHNMVVKNCLTFLNKAKGFDQNNNLGSMTILNCTSFRNGIGTSGGAYNFSVPGTLATGKLLTVENCISHVFTKSPGYTFGTQTSPIFVTDSWMAPFVAATNVDFISIDTTGVRGSRKADGSLPDINFMHLASNSQFVNAGTNVGLSFIGTAPDLGCFESSILTGVADQSKASIPNTFTLYQNYPNPFNPSTEIGYHVASAGIVKLSVYDLLGQEVATLVNAQRQPGNYTVEWNAARMSSGMYFARLSVLTGKGQSFTQTRKMMFTK
jgi:Protein of unknown function (DUF1565).